MAYHKISHESQVFSRYSHESSGHITCHRKYSGQHNQWDIRSRKVGKFECNTNLLLTEREGRTGEYWPGVVAVRPVAVRPRVNIFILLTKREGHTGRMSARGLDSTD